MRLTSRLKHEVRKLSSEIKTHPVARKLRDGSAGAELYGAFMTQTRLYVRETAPSLALAGEQLRRQHKHLAIADLLLQKAGEESGHDGWALEDCIAIGYSRETILNTPPVPAVMTYNALIRFIAQSDMPIAILGIAFMLESLARLDGAVAVRNLSARSTIPRIQQGISFIARHVVADERHLAELIEVLDGLSDPREQEQILLSARVTRMLYMGMLTSLV